MEKNEGFDKMKKTFCGENRIKVSSVRFVFEGERIHEDETPESLGIKNGDIIEVFTMMTGGGRPEKKNIFGNNVKILDALDLSVSGDSDDFSSMDENEEELIPNLQEKVSLAEKETKLMVKFVDNVDFESSIEDKEILEVETNGSLENVSKETEALIEIQAKVDQIETDVETSEILLGLRKDYEDGKLQKSNPLDMKIIHFLKQSKLAPVELNILTNLSEQRSFHKEWQNEKDQLYPEYKKQIKKKANIKSDFSPVDEDYTQNNDVESGNEYEVHKIQDDYSLGETPQKRNESINESEIEKTQNNYLLKETPQKRMELFKRFGIKTPSPLIKLSKATEKEMKQLSIAVHLWAENKNGGTKMLQIVRLKKNHFKEILSFAGPRTRYNLIKDRSAAQYQNLWRNTAQSKDYFRGDSASGFENDSGLHDPSKKFCPFEHCMTGIQGPMTPLEMDLLYATPKQTPRLRSLVSSTRKLFETVDDIPSVFEETDGIPDSVKPSPRKEELNLQKRKLLQEIKFVSEKLARYDQEKEEGREGKEERSKQYNPALVRCRSENCDKEFTTMFGLIKHQRKHHPEENIGTHLEKCQVCGKDVLYIDRHMKTVHKEVLTDRVCEICRKIIKSDMKKHRGECNKCPTCGKKETKKIRLLKHIGICELLRNVNSEQMIPLDLTSPLKQTYQSPVDVNVVSVAKHHDPSSKLKHSNQSTVDPSVAPVDNHQDPTSQLSHTYQRIVATLGNQQKDKQGTDKPPSIQVEDYGKFSPTNTTTMKDTIGQIPTTDAIDDRGFPVLLDVCNIEEQLNQKRNQYPFKGEHEEEYESEFEEDDDKEYTNHRRENKDMLEIRLREIDQIPNLTIEGDDEIVNQFRNFMQVTTMGENNGESSEAIAPSTIGMYTKSVQNDILKAFHQLFKPFDSRWLLDCTTQKVCTFEGQGRVFVDPCEPIYLTARVLRKALERYKSGVDGQQRALVVAAAVQFMNFIELNFNDKLNLYGREPLEKIISYHNGVKSFINGTKIWKTCNKDKKKGLKNSKVLKEYEKPNHESEILNKYQEYLKSPERISQIRKILHFSTEGAQKPSDKEMTELGKIAMGEVITSTGCRPVVVYRLLVGGYVGKKPGFNPRQITKEDCVVDEEYDDKKIFRRLNPSLPPKHLACTHQIQHKLAICPQNCENRCDPSGFNIFCDWDKTRDTNGPSYLHLAKPIKDILDLYDIIKSRFFEGRKTKTGEDNWLHNENTHFFLNSSGSPFQAVDLKHLSEAMGIDVTAYSFRQIVSTWALSHDSEEIRLAEGEALQHSLRVAHDHYLQNKMLKPQTLTQRYIAEEGILPDELREEIKRTEIKSKEKISETEQKRQKKQHSSLLKKSEAKKELQRERKPLGPRNRIQGIERNKIKKIIEEITGENIENTLKERTPMKFRNYIVRTVCATKGVSGEEIRNIWVKIYRGDERWGVRDVRFRAKANNWPKKDSNACFQKKDRNSWIASCILKSLQAEAKLNEKKNNMKQTQ